MLKSILQNISSNEERYGSHLWTYRISANSLELSVHPKHRNNPDSYREAVIYAGQVLQAVSQEIMKHGCHVMIQSFPNLEEPELVALIRTIRNINSRSDDMSGHQAFTLPANQPFIQFVRSTASHYGISLHEIVKSGKPELSAAVSKLALNGNSGNYLLLTTVSDNPFDWLKTGQWIERVQQLRNENRSIPEIRLSRLNDHSSRSGLREQLDDHRYPQIVIASGRTGL